MREVRVPADLWQEGDAAIAAWLYSGGELVREGSVIAELMVEKSSFEIVAPASGTLTILIPAEESVSKGQLVATID